jgi:hypothetical protein
MLMPFSRGGWPSLVKPEANTTGGRSSHQAACPFGCVNSSEFESEKLGPLWLKVSATCGGVESVSLKASRD